MQPDQIISGLQSPYGLAFDADDVLFVAESESGCIRRIADDGKAIAFAETGGRPNEIAFDDSGDLFVAENGRHHLLLISPDEAVEVYASQSRGRRFRGPRGLSFSPAGNVLFTDTGKDEEEGGAVYRANLDGEVELVTSDLAAPSGIALAEDAIRLFVSESAASRVICLELDDEEQLQSRDTFIEFDDGAGAGAIRFDSQGLLYIARQGIGVTVIDPDGAVAATIELPGGQPTGMAFGGLNYDELFIAEAETGGVYRYQLDRPGQRPFAGPRSV